MSARVQVSAEAPCVVVAALSARWLAEAGQRAGFKVLALDAFGDADTRAASSAWWPIGDETAPSPRLSAARLRAGLRLAGRFAAEQAWSLQGWIPGPGCDALLEEMAAGADGSGPEWPGLRGNPAAVCRATREAGRFFALLDRLGLPYPPTRASPPQRLEGWLRKNLGLSGGWGVTQANASDTTGAQGGVRISEQTAEVCWQADLPGEPWSLLFLAGSHGVRVLGTQRQHTRALGARPYVFAGLSGPLHAPAGLSEPWAAAALSITQKLGLRGLCSLDLVVEPATREWHIVELNPRPSASLQLYPHWPLLRWHLQACTEGRLPGSDEMAGEPAPAQAWRVVFTPQALSLPPGALQRWAADQRDIQVHDLPDPAAPLTVPAGAPLCSLSQAWPAPLDSGGLPPAEQRQASLAHAEAQLISTCTTLTS